MASKRKPLTPSERTRAAKKGWETRRKRNPEKWDRRFASKIRDQELAKEALDFATKYLERAGSPENLEALSKAEEERAKVEQRISNLHKYGIEDPPQLLKDLADSMWQFVFVKDANLDSDDIKKHHKKWYEQKQKLKELLSTEAFERLMFRLGRVVGLAETGKFSIMSFITS